MIKIFLVEDEVVMRNGIKNNIPWEKEGLLFAGEASDGELAYPLIKKVQPDILITDIRMPFMDGLELSELVKKEFPKIKIIILSGYNEFDYAKQAIHIGVTDYLLKPITASKLLEAVKKVAEVIEREREEENMLERYRLEMAENTVLDRQRLFKDLVTSRISFKEALERGEQLGMELSASFYQLMLFKLIPSGPSSVWSDRVLSCQEAIEERMEGRQHILVFDRGEEGWAFILTGESEQEVERRTRDCAAGLGDLVRTYKDIQFFGSIGGCVNRLGDLQQSYGQAGRAFASRFFSEMNQVVSYSEMEQVYSAAGEAIDIHSVDGSKVNRRTLEHFLKQGTVEEAVSFVEEYFQNIGEKNYHSFMFRQYIIMDCYLCARTFLEELGMDMKNLPREVTDMEGTLKESHSMETLKERLVSLFKETMSLRDGQTASKYSQVLEEAMAFIRENYAKEEISLNTVASRVNISPSYFSSIFSQEMGVTFVEYLTSVRMERAKELLMCSNMKTSEIGYEVGYKDSHYFGYLFKKTVGCTPKEYRAGSRERS
ncbi:response regulator [Enterocloster citroniae]|uniref:response regulator n=1 Tax=Enterocloster citroniae TaxID=358743 RepID=UPI001898AA0E|nr:response regulator [Enterocloster citroniae]